MNNSIQLSTNTIVELQSYIDSIENDTSLCNEKEFDRRTEVVDFIGFGGIAQIEALLQKGGAIDKLILLKHKSEKIKEELEKINSDLFQKLRENIRTGKCEEGEFKNLINEYFSFNNYFKEHSEEPGYDNLDILINGIFSAYDIPEPTKDLEPGMIYYQKTPARVVFELATKCQFIKGDVFFDVGSGLGQAAVLVNLLTGTKVKGVEFEPAFCEYATRCAMELNLSNATFINADARQTDYSEGTVFFMYTPFKDEIMQSVLEILRKESLLRKIKIITYGPCANEVALQNWLNHAKPEYENIYKLCIFNSF